LCAIRARNEDMKRPVYERQKQRQQVYMKYYSDLIEIYIVLCLQGCLIVFLTTVGYGDVIRGGAE